MMHQLNDIARTGAKVHTILRDVTAAVPGATVRDARLALGCAERVTGGRRARLAPARQAPR